MILGRLDDVADALGRADIAGVDAQAGGARLGRFDGPLVVEMDVGDGRHGARGDGLRQRPRRCRVRAGGFRRGGTTPSGSRGMSLRPWSQMSRPPALPVIRLSPLWDGTG